MARRKSETLRFPVDIYDESALRRAAKKFSHGADFRIIQESFFFMVTITPKHAAALTRDLLGEFANHALLFTKQCL
jgi:hypothetical protein